ncbi:hypothetical protein EST38_g12601 [Candolleomyces aberdarensis]|uniref:Arrestin C-terminal-like domain-containing protein n=1 Tax=Candolleomyces aberdarensis TaxID=2316362 RepID=A0A4Q2D354_9AGAR|nr:hypothetical protein EST38_g12601 [Candolleomyces aberdarensis]
MSNITIELRPPPNVDFVNGFPGIPPSGQERPQATVKGAIEVRVSPPTGIKAKWVRIELRKVEVLPPGGESNLYWDCIGTPVNLWQATEEYGLLRTQDFPFSIRIPESIPPSVELEGRASIGYELLASVCMKGKRGFLRKAKSTVATSKALITIDKHELHSTWPIYNQPEIRHVSQEGINLMVERNHTCFGPGDRVAVTATVKSDSMHTVILRGFEIALKETTVLRAGPYGAGRRTQPQVRTISIAENKVMLNATMYGGQQKQAELSCTLNTKHTTPTLNAARHIDVTYTLMVKAVMGTGENLVMDLPVIISNWQRDVSASAIQQIGPTPNLSMLTTTPTGSQNPNSQGFYGATHTGNTGRAPVQASTLPVGRTSAERPAHGRQGSGGGVNHYATANPALSKLPVDEFGYSSTTTATPGRPTVTPINTGTNPTARPTSSRSTDNRANRLTITNPHPSDIYSEDYAGGSSSGRPQQRSQVDNAPKQWPSAEEEKRLYEQARSRVETTQGPHAAPAPLSYRTSPPPGGSSSGFGGGSSSAAVPSQANGNPDPWMSAEEEKVMLFNKAQAAVLRNQTGAEPSAGMGMGSSSYPNHHRTPSDHATPAGSSSMSNKPSGAQLYQQAMAARKNPSPSQATPIKGGPAFASAEQEKAALRRYQEAREAVDRTQGGLGPEESSQSGPVRDSGPIAYEALFPNAGSSSVNRSPPPTANQEPPPPPFAGGAPVGPMAILSEKERLKREYEARDAAALAAQQQQQQPSYAAPPPAFASAAPPPFTPSAPAPSQYASAIAEKEALRRKFEAQDRAVAAAALPPPAPLQTPSRNSSAKPVPSQPIRGGSYTAPLSPGARPTPSTPGGSSRVLTAAEEKALLKAKFDAQDAAGSRPPAPLQPSRANGRVNGATATPSPPPFSNGAPPPLMPRPPVEYIQETREEDARVARYTMMNGENPATMEDGYGMNGGPKLPPLPPKPAGSD